MPNTSRPSRDCHLCRERRIKCDLTRPGCIRCARRHVPCPGYRSEVDVLFRNENLSTLATRASRDRGIKSRAATDVSNLRPKNPSAFFVQQGYVQPNADSERYTGLVHRYPLAARSVTTVPRPLSSSPILETEELPLVLDHFTSSPGWQRHDGGISFLTQMVQQSAEDSALIYSCRATARAHFSNRHQTRENRAKELYTYGKALVATNAVLQDRKACSSEDTALASVWLLGLHEVIAGAPNSRRYPAPITWATHTKGLLSLLRLRIPGMFETRPGRNLFWLVNRSIQMHCFIAEVECPGDTLAWLAAIESHLAEDEYHSHQSALHSYHASLLNARMKQLLASKDGPLCATIRNLICEVQQLERRISHDLIRTVVDQTICLTIVSMHNFYRVIRMKVRSSLWELLNSAKYGPEPQLDSLTCETQSELCLDLISMWSDEVLETITVVLDFEPPREVAASGKVGLPSSRVQKWHDALALLWPLRLVAWLRYSSDDQKMLARAGLRRIACEFYILHALNP